MASTEKIKQLESKIKEMKAIDLEKVLRPSLGAVSTESELRQVFDDIFAKMDTAVEIAPKVSNSHMESIMSALNGIHAEMNTRVEYDNAQYVSTRDQFLSQIFVYYDQLQQWWPFFITAQIEDRGLLGDEALAKQRQQLLAEIEEESQATIERIRKESTEVIEKAKSDAKDIVGVARRVARKVSVEEAQSQFEEARKSLVLPILMWSSLSFASVIAFILIAVGFLKVEISAELTWHVIYYTAIRITILTAIGAVAAFLMKMLRAYLHMYQHNLHRKRLSNSMAAFVESAATDQQRDLILAHLVDAVANFGSSGLLQKEDDSIYSPKMTIDTITRTITTPENGA